MYNSSQDYKWRVGLSIIIAIFLAFICPMSVRGEDKGDSQIMLDYTTASSVLDEAGGWVTWGLSASLASVGQPSPIGRSSDGMYENRSGFLYSIINQPDIDLPETAIDFHRVSIGNTEDKSFYVSNLGATVICSVYNVIPDTSLFTITDPPPSSFPQIIEAGGSLKVTVCFAPTSPGPIISHLTITSNDPDEPTRTVTLQGEGWEEPLPQIELSVAELSFEEVFVDSTEVDSFYIYNTGNDILIVDSAYCDNPNFDVLTTEFPATIDTSGTFEVKVRFQPTEVQVYSSHVTITSNDSDDTPYDLPVNGRGVALLPEIALSDTSLDFGQVQTGTSMADTFTISNTGSATLVLNNLVCDNSDYEVVIPDTFPQHLEPDGSLQVTVTFTPSVEDTILGNLIIYSNDPDDSTVTLNLSGVGALEALPHITVLQDSLVFGGVELGSSRDMSFAISNTGQATLVLYSLVCDPADNFEVSVPDTFPQNIEPDSSLDVTVTFTATSESTFAGLLTIFSNDPGEDSTVTVTLSGRGVVEAVQDIALSETTLSFGRVTIGESSFKNFIISNSGSATLTVDNVSSDRAYFEVTEPLFPRMIDPTFSVECSVKFTPSDTGDFEGTLTVYSNDPDEDSLTVNLNGVGVAGADVTVPTINHSAMSSVNAGEVITLLAVIIDEGTGVQTAILHCREGGEAAFTQQDTMQNTSGDNYQGLIPASSVTERGLEYYISATDGAGNTVSTPTYGVTVNVTDLNIDSPLPAGAYRMISIPIDPSEGSPQIVLEDDLGSYNNTIWRLGRWSPAETVYHELTVSWTSADNFAPGRGYWLIVKDSKSFDVSGSSVNVSDDYTITLQPGWNQIGCPFAFSVSWADVIKDTLVEDRLIDYVSGGYQDVTVLSPWHGYWVKNNSTGAIDILVPPVENSTSLKKEISTFSPETIWKIQLSVRCGKYQDAYNFAGVSPDAADSWDGLDYSEPPVPPGSYVSLFFPHRDRGLYPGDYATDFRGEFEEGQTWDVVVETDLSQTIVELDINGVESIPERFAVWLFDRAAAQVVDLRQETRWEYMAGPSGSRRSFQLVVGTQEYVEDQRDQLPVIPRECCLYQNWPNPFNPETEIAYQLPVVDGQALQQVTLRIYNILGQEVRVLVDDEPRGSGYHTVRWNGRDSYDVEVASGIYFYRLTVGDGRWSASKKMVLLR